MNFLLNDEIHLKIEPFHDIYLFQTPDTPHRSRRSADHHTERLNNHEKVLWAEQQISRNRVKRDHVEISKLSKLIQKREVLNKYDDPEWEKQWYLVSRNFELGIKFFISVKSFFFK